MAFARKWMQLEIIMLHKISQTQKYKRDIFFHTENLITISIYLYRDIYLCIIYIFLYR